MTRRRHTPVGRVVLWVLVASWGATAAGTLAMPAVHRIQSAEIRPATELSAPPGADGARDEPARGIRPPWRDPPVPEMKRYKPHRQRSLTA